MDTLRAAERGVKHIERKSRDSLLCSGVGFLHERLRQSFYTGVCGSVYSMISLTLDYVRLFIEKDRPFDEVTESVRTALQICRVNSLPAAIVISEQAGFDWRSSMRVAIRFVAARWSVSSTKLALVIFNAEEVMRNEVCEVATNAGFACKVFDQEAQAIEWVSGGVVE